MKTNLIIAGVSWSASLVAAAWVGKTYFADSATEHRSAAPTVISTTRVLQENGTPTSTQPEAAGSTIAAASKALTLYADTQRPLKDRIGSLLEVDDPMERMTGLIDLIQSLEGNEDFGSAVTLMMENFEPRGRGRELSMLMTEWAKRDPQAALAAMDKVGDWPGRYGASTVLQTWAKSDPTSAKAWAMEKGKDGNPEDGNWYMVGVVSGLAKKDLDLAATWAQEQPRSRARGEMMDKLLDGFTKQRGLQAAQEFVNGLEAGAFRDGMTRKVAGKLIEKDPAEASSWIATLPAGESRTGAMTDLANRWSERDPNAAGNWLKSYPISPETDEPRQSFAWNIREKDPESAIAWAGTIADPKRRDKMLVELVRDWSKRDKNGAMDYMTRNNWPEEAQKKAVK